MSDTLKGDVTKDIKMEIYRLNMVNDKLGLLTEDSKPYCCMEDFTNQNPSDYGSTKISPISSEPARVVLRWKNISVFTKPPEGRFWLPKKEEKLPSKQIVSDVSGIALPGQLLAIMGASGSGKTTLLNVLTLRSQRNLDVRGSVLINGKQPTPGAMAKTSGYVQQDDLFFGTLTVKEQLTFQALLRMDSHLTYSQRMKRVEEVIVELGLADCQNTLIGVPGRVKGISGGEKRRLSFAAEVLTDPLLMFCDEPTSGLDIFMAQNVVELLRSLAAKGKTVICTIHQPSSTLFALFDRIMLMSEGKVAFLGSPDEALNFFSSIHHACPPNYNPADHFINLLSGKEEQVKREAEKICQTFASSEAAVIPLDELEKLSLVDSDKWTVHENGLTSEVNNSHSRYKASSCQQFRAVLWRSYLCVIREPLLFKMRLYQTLIVSMIIGIAFWQQKLNQRGISNINGALFIIPTNLTYQYVPAVINVICGELPIFLRERRNGMYRTDVYFICKNIAEIPVFILMPLILTTLLYWMIGLDPQPSKYFYACVIIVLVSNVCVSVGYLLSTVSSSISIAITLLSPVILPVTVFSGFLLNISSIPWFLNWIQYLSWLRYGFEALVVNQWTDITNIDCGDTNTTCIRSGAVVLHNYQFNQESLGFNIFMLIVLIVSYKLVALLALFIRVRRAQ